MNFLQYHFPYTSIGIEKFKYPVKHNKSLFYVWNFGHSFEFNDFKSDRKMLISIWYKQHNSSIDRKKVLLLWSLWSHSIQFKWTVYSLFQSKLQEVEPNMFLKIRSYATSIRFENQPITFLFIYAALMPIQNNSHWNLE